MTKPAPPAAAANPLLEDGPVPAYDRVHTGHFLPALAVRLAAARDKRDDLRARNTKPALDDLAALEDVFAGPAAVLNVMGTFHLSQCDDALRAAYQSAMEEYDSFSKSVFQDPQIAARIRALHDDPHLPADEEDRQILKSYYRNFEADGAFLSARAQQDIRTIDQKLIGLSAQFLANLAKGATQQAVHITDRKMLTGVPEDVVAAMAEKAREDGKDGWLYIPERLQVDALLACAADREFRRLILTALNAIGTQAPYDNRPLIAEMQKLRQDRTALLGPYKHYADWALDGTMAGSLARAEKTLRDCGDRLLPAFEKDIAAITAFAAQNGGPAQLEAWDSAYWAARYKKDKFGFDADELAQYLPLDAVMEGLVAHTEKLFGVRWTENKSCPRLHDDVVCYDITDVKTGASAGLLYIDFFARPGSKEGGAWMEHMQPRDDQAGKVNIVSVNMNYTKPAGGAPTLLDIGAVETLYHEAGHAFHGLLGTQTKYKTAQGPTISSDFFEIHSMAQEYWAFAPENVKSYARHHATGAPVPDALIAAHEKSAQFFAAREMLLVIQNALRDFEFHKRAPQDYRSDKHVEQAAALSGPAAQHIRPYPLTRFAHLFSAPVGGYAAGYYGYFWAGLQAAAVFDHFDRAGLYDPQRAQSLKEFYQEGGRRDPNAIFERFNGGPATAEALLRVAGLESAARKPPPRPAPAP